MTYDIANKKSFQNALQWLKEIKEYSNDKVMVIFVGNKSDLANKFTSINEGERSVLMKPLDLHRKMDSFTWKHQPKLAIMWTMLKIYSFKLFSEAAIAIIEKIKIGEIDPSNEALGIKKGDDIQNTLHNRQEKNISGGCNC